MCRGIFSAFFVELLFGFSKIFEAASFIKTLFFTAFSFVTSPYPQSQLQF